MPQNNTHRKHADLKRPDYGNFGRNELAVLGVPCHIIKNLVEDIAVLLSKFNIAYADAGHQKNGTNPDTPLQVYTEKANTVQVAHNQLFTNFQKHALFNDADLVLINGNHFDSDRQIVIIHPEKNLEHKLDKLTDVELVLLAGEMQLPGYLKPALKATTTVLNLDDRTSIAGFLTGFIEKRVPTVKGLVLAGGGSTRMQADKGSIAYHGKSQRAHSFGLLEALCSEVYISGKAEDAYPVIEDTFIGLGPFAGILSAMQRYPDAAWLTIACDLPYLSAETLNYLVANRNPSKIATAFLDSDGKFPEPLITIWEPRAYPVMLQFLSQGYSCPRKVLINTDTELLTAPDASEFKNVNLPHERDEALHFFGAK